MANIRHVFVLMMENRSFDHLFGFSGIPGVPEPDPSWHFSRGAVDNATIDPRHEFEDVQAQIAGNPPMSGFAAEGQGDPIVMKGFEPEQIPVVTALAREFVLFDNWFSSMPGPTWPNRFFVHAASSGGLSHSPSGLTSAGAVEIDALGFSFENGTIFDRLTQRGKAWRVYHADAFPQVLAIKGLVNHFFKRDNFREMHPGASADAFATDLKNTRKPYDVDYTFIEPSYGLLSGNFSKGNSQHPVGSMSAGEQFIKYVYESIRNSPVWQSSILLITWDEHGGFFDHVEPPAAVAPGDQPLNANGAEAPQFGFDRLGVRVPALLVSPWVPRGKLGSDLFPDKGRPGEPLIFDHASVIASLRELFGLGGPLTRRDGNSPTWLDAIQPAPRSGADDGPVILAAMGTEMRRVTTVRSGDSGTLPSSASGAPPTGATGLATGEVGARTGTGAAATTPVVSNAQIAGFALIAHAVDLQMALESADPEAAKRQSLNALESLTQSSPQTASVTHALRAPDAPHAGALESAPHPVAVPSSASGIATAIDATASMAYVSAVAQRAAQHRRK